MSLLLRMLGSCFILLAAYGTGAGISLHHRLRCRQLHTFARLLQYLRGLLKYQPLTGGELLFRSQAYPEFMALGLEHCSSLPELPIPDAMPAPLQTEVREGLSQMEMQPREEACETLCRLAALCEEAAQTARHEADAAQALWPRLGLCVGVLIVILLW